MNTTAIVIGVGEIGAVFTRSILRLGHPVFPIDRDTDLPGLARVIDRARLGLDVPTVRDIQRSIHMR